MTSEDEWIARALTAAPELQPLDETPPDEVVSIFFFTVQSMLLPWIAFAGGDGGGGDGGDGGDGGGADEEEDSSMGVVRPPLQPWKSAAAVVTNEVPACPHPYPTLSLPQKSTTSRPSRLSVEVPARPFATLHPSPPKAHPTPPSADRRRLLFQARLVVCQGERSLGEVLLLHWWYPLLPDGIVAAAAAAGRAAGGMGLGDRRGDGRAVLLQPVER